MISELTLGRGNIMSGVLNVGFLNTWNGIFKSLQLVLGAFCVETIGYHFNNYLEAHFKSTIEYYFLVATCFSFIGTFILFISYLISPATASMIPKTIYEFLYYSIASILLLAASIAMIVNVLYYNKSLLAVSICSLVNTVFYICGAVIGFNSYGDR